MGQKQTKIIKTAKERKSFMQYVLRDLKALEMMLEKDMFEKGIKRIGAEQELNFVDKSWRPAPIAMEVLKDLPKDFFTTEYAKFNLEINSRPVEFNKNCLTDLKNDLVGKLDQVRTLAGKHEARVVLTGILPTIRKSDVGIDALTPEPRFEALFNIVLNAKEEDYEYNIKGIDELITRDNLSVFGGTMTSFQVHLQIAAKEILKKFNWAQAISGPLLAAATNSPMFLGKRLWRETRIALFQQTTDVRKPYMNLKEEDARVSFGHDWLKESIMEEFQDDVARHTAYLSTKVDEDSVEMVENGEIPNLKALTFHNGTIYKWNRACYGVTEGKPHLRIENRILPSGPTMEDQIANAAFWIGVMNGMPKEYDQIHKKIAFDEVKNNFLKAAQMGLEVQFKWINNKLIPAHDLILNELLPMAKAGLLKEKVSKISVDHYLGIIRDRVETGMTGSQWMLDSYAKLSKKTNADEALVATTAAMVRRQDRDIPVHKWKAASISDAGGWKNRIYRIDQIMSTNLYTVRDEDVVDLAAHIMNWKSIGHIPVENKKGKLIGLITKDALINYLVNNFNNEMEALSVKDIMIKDLITVEPEMNITEAIKLMLDNNLSCLPVCQDNKIIGIVTEHDFITVSKKLFSELSDLNNHTNGISKKQSAQRQNQS